MHRQHFQPAVAVLTLLKLNRDDELGFAVGQLPQLLLVMQHRYTGDAGLRAAAIDVEEAITSKPITSSLCSACRFLRVTVAANNNGLLFPHTEMIQYAFGNSARQRNQHQR